MRMILAILAASLGFGAWSLTGGLPLPSSETAVHTAPHYSLWSEGEETGCRFESPDADLDDLTIAGLEDCARAFAPFANASRVVMGRDEGLLVLDREGNTLIEFAVADGFAMQSVMPASPILSLALEPF